jgi:hypothetical protein
MNSSLQEITRNPLWWYWISLVPEEIPSRRNATTQKLIDLGDTMEGKLDFISIWPSEVEIIISGG